MNGMTPEQTRETLRRLRAGLYEIYETRLHGVFLFGSYARNDFDPESDFDVLIVLDQVDDYGAEIERTSRLIAGLSLEYGVSISRVFLSRESWTRGQSAFIQNVREEAIPA